MVYKPTYNWGAPPYQVPQKPDKATSQFRSATTTKKLVEVAAGVILDAVTSLTYKIQCNTMGTCDATLVIQSHCEENLVKHEKCDLLFFLIVGYRNIINKP